MCAPAAVHLVDDQRIVDNGVLHRARWEAGKERKLEEA